MAKKCCAKRLVYRYVPVANGWKVRWWDASAGPHLDPIEWAGPADPVTGIPLPTNTAPNVDNVNSSAVPNDSNSGLGNARYGLIEAWVLLPDDVTHWRDNNGNTGELGMVLTGDCCSSLVELDGGNHTVNTGGSDRHLMDTLPVNSGWHYVVAVISDVSAAAGLSLQFSTDNASTFKAVDLYQPTQPEVECKEVSQCAGVPNGWQVKPLNECCQPTYSTPSEGGATVSLCEQVGDLGSNPVVPSTALVVFEDGANGCGKAPLPEPVEIPDQEVCDNLRLPFTSSPSGWWNGWSPTTTDTAGTIDYVDWRTVVTRTNVTGKVVDASFYVNFGNWYTILRRVRAYLWLDYRVLVNGTAIITRVNSSYRYQDERTTNEVNPVQIEIWPMGSAESYRYNIPVGAVVEIQTKARYNVNADQDSATHRMIGGVRSHGAIEWHLQDIVTGRQP